MAEQAAVPTALTARYRGRNVLAIGAHPDDIELGAGGLIARLGDEGVSVTMIVVCTPNNREARMSEAKKAAEILGATSRFLYPQREMRVEDVKSYELVEQLDRLVREYDPAAVITHAASNFHYDHVLVHKACVAAQRLHFFDMLCYYPTSCHPVTTSFHPHAFVDITRQVDRKMAAINEYVTQFHCRGLTTDHYVGVARDYGRLAGVEYAEGLEIARLSLG